MEGGNETPGGVSASQRLSAPSKVKEVTSKDTPSPTPFTCSSIVSCSQCTGTEGCGMCINGLKDFGCVDGNASTATQGACKMYLYHKCSGPEIGCPVGCSGHGKCTHTGCECDSGFGGEDCSEDEDKLSGAPVIVVGVVIGFAMFAVAVIVSIQLYGHRCMFKRRSRFNRNHAYSDGSFEEEQELCAYEHPQSPPPDPMSSASSFRSKSNSIGKTNTISSSERGRSLQRRAISPYGYDAAFVKDEYDGVSPAVMKYGP